MMQPDEATVEEVQPELMWIWRAWHRLTHDRQWQTRGFGMPMGGTMITPFPCSLPWTAMRAWSEAHGYTESEELFLDHCLLALDKVFIEWFAEQQKQKS